MATKTREQSKGTGRTPTVDKSAEDPADIYKTAGLAGGYERSSRLGGITGRQDPSVQISGTGVKRSPLSSTMQQPTTTIGEAEHRESPLCSGNIVHREAPLCTSAAYREAPLCAANRAHETSVPPRPKPPRFGLSGREAAVEYTLLSWAERRAGYTELSVRQRRAVKLRAAAELQDRVDRRREQVARERECTCDRNSARSRKQLAAEGVEENPGPGKSAVARGKEPEAQASTSSPRPPKKNTYRTCFRCGQPGHTIAECPMPAPKNKPGSKSWKEERETPEGAVLAGENAAKVVARVREQDYAVKVEALRTKWADMSSHQARQLIDLGHYDGVIGADLTLDRVMDNLGLVPPAPPAPPPPPADPPAPLPVVPVRGAYLGTSEWRRRTVPKRILVTGAAMILWALLGLIVSFDYVWASKTAQTWVMTNAPKLAHLVTDRAVYFEASAVRSLDLWYTQLGNKDPGKARRYTFWYRQVRAALRPGETWTEYLNARNASTAARITLGVFRVLGPLASAVRIIFYTVTAPVWLPFWFYYNVGPAIIYLREACLLIYQDPMILADMIFGLEDISMEVVAHQLALPEAGLISRALEAANYFCAAINYWRHTYLVCALFWVFVLVDFWGVWYGTHVHVLQLEVREDRLRTNAHVDLLKRPIHVHHYRVGGVLPLFWQRELCVVDHWVSVALSEFGYKSDADMFLKNVHLKFLRVAELGIADVDYARYKEDTVEYLRLALLEDFTLGRTRLTNAGPPVYVH